MAYENNDKLSTVESSAARCLRLIQSIQESGHGLQTKNRHKCRMLASQFEAMSRMLYEIASYEPKKKMSQAHSGDEVDVLDDLDDIVDSSEENNSEYSAKMILHSFAVRLKLCAQVGLDTVEMNRFADVVSLWYHTRYLPECPNPNFRYRADRICEWIDALILCYGAYMQSGKCTEFLSKMRDWVVVVSRDDGELWQLPYFVSSFITSQNVEDFTCEAILVERIFKKAIYDDSFYPMRMHTVEDKVLTYYPELAGKSVEDLLGLIHHPLATTSSFDASKYQEVAP